MTLQQIKSFIAVADCGSFNKAEENTFLTKQALKKQIDTLEAELGFSLITRSTKGIQLTDAGQHFYSNCIDSLKHLDILLSEGRSISRNADHIRIGNPPHPRFLLEKVLRKYSIEYPDIHQNIVITKGNLAQKILDGQLDVAEFIYRPQNLMEGVSYQKICVMEYACLMMNNHPLVRQDSISLEDLAPYTVGISCSSNMELCRRLRAAIPDIQIQDLPNSDLNSIMNICYNRGVCVSKAYFTRSLAPLVAIPLSSNLKYECGVIYREKPSLPVRHFLDMIHEVYPESAQ